MTTTKNIKPLDSSEIAMLKAKIAELESLQQKSNQVSEVEEEVEDKKIQQDDYINVMSLLPYNLNLSTKEGGQGSIKKFTKFGEVKRILYRDLVDIMEVNKNFLESGYFYIMNPQLIRQHGLDDVYSKILTKEKMEELLATKTDSVVDLYSSANEGQQEILVQLLIDQVKDNPNSVNLNVIDKISRISKVDISKKAEEAREVSELETVE